MAIIPESQLVLMRKQREFKQLLAARDFAGLIVLEKELITLLDIAISDTSRSPKDLLKQLGQLTSLYRELSSVCHFAQTKSRKF